MAEITRDEIADIIAPGARPWSQNYKAARVKADAILARLGDGWEPIESAPKDGTRIIGARFGRYFRLALMWWQPEFEAWISSACLMTMAPGYTVDGKSEKLHSPEIENPTHWMVFPSPPKESE
jgi:hypothetical protein